MRREEREWQRRFNRRAIIMGGIQGGMISVLFARLYYLSVVESEKYKVMAEKNRVDLRLLPAQRGQIIERNGLIIAKNRQNYRIVLVPEQTNRGRRIRSRAELLNHVSKTLDKLAELIPISEHNRQRVLQKASRKRFFIPITVVENLSWTDFARVNVNAPDIPGIAPEVGESRYYPSMEVFSHITGYVSAVSRQDLESDTDPILELPGFHIGKFGIEKIFEKDLRGKSGMSRVEVNAMGRVIREIQRDAGQTGHDLQLTLSYPLQDYAKKRLGSESGAVVVIDTQTGEMIVTVSTPGYDPNKFVVGLSNADWQTLNQNPNTPMTNRAVSGQYPPGSTFKMVVALAGLEAGIITSRERVLCEGYIEFGTRRFHCWKKDGHGGVNLHKSIRESCDIYFYQIAQRIGIDRIADMARRLGLGRAPDIGLSSVRSGLIPDKKWKRDTKGEPWYKGETLNASIGQGQVLATPLQLAVMTARIANGSQAIQPVLIKSIGGTEILNPNQAQARPLGIDPENMAIIRRSMEAVVNESRGTAYASAVPLSEGGIAGKTGTVQVKGISRLERESGLRKNEEKKREERDHALFVGFGPIKTPRYAISVIIEHGGSGSRAAAPVASDILRQVMRQDPSRLTPDPLPQILTVPEVRDTGFAL